MEKNYYYAEIDDNNICYSVSDLGSEINKATLIKIPEYDLSYLGKRYENGEWSEVERLETEYEPTETDIINAEILLNQADILAKQNEHDEVLAEILLNQMGV